MKQNQTQKKNLNFVIERKQKRLKMMTGEKKKQTFDEDMLMDLGNRRPEEDGVGVVGLGTVTGESETASLDLLEREEDSSSVLGT